MVTGLMVRITERDVQIVKRDEAIASKDCEIKYRQAQIDQLTHEMAVLKRWKFGRSREQLDSTQASLLDEAIFARAGLGVPRSTLGAWVGQCGLQLQPLVDALRQELLGHRVLHADETPVAMLKPGNKKTHHAYLWAYAPGAFEDMKAVVYDFCESRAGEHARAFLGDWKGALVCDDFSGYKQSFTLGVTEAGYMAHSRRKFLDLHVSNKSQIAGQALSYISALYDVERKVKSLPAYERLHIRRAQSRPLADGLYQWMELKRRQITDGSATAKALDYSLKRWATLTRFLDDGQLPIDKNWAENQIRPVAIGRKNWLFAGSLRAGQRAAAVMSLIQSARLNGHDAYAISKMCCSVCPHTQTI